MKIGILAFLFSIIAIFSSCSPNPLGYDAQSQKQSNAFTADVQATARSTLQSIQPSTTTTTVTPKLSRNLEEPKSLLACTRDELTALLDQNGLNYRLQDTENGWKIIVVLDGNFPGRYAFSLDKSGTFKLMHITIIKTAIKNEILNKAESLYGKASYTWKDMDANECLEYYYQFDIDPHTFYTLIVHEQGNIDECYSTYPLDGSTPPSIW